LLKTLAENIAAALAVADPSHRRDFERNLAALIDRLDALHRRIQRTLAPYRGRSFYVFHPGFGYFADAYGLRQEAVEAGGHSPTPPELRTLIERARADGIKAIFVQPQYAPQSAQVVAEQIGGRVVVINGLAKDVLADIEDIATKVAAAMKEGGRGKR
jgi:zinc transport system substrate-binding protein